MDARCGWSAAWEFNRSKTGWAKRYPQLEARDLKRAGARMMFDEAIGMEHGVSIGETLG